MNSIKYLIGNEYNSPVFKIEDEAGMNSVLNYIEAMGDNRVKDTSLFDGIYEKPRAYVYDLRDVGKDIHDYTGITDFCQMIGIEYRVYLNTNSEVIGKILSGEWQL
tara:strand:- start:5877 stop:6194 length:318 start_codon:yes stop_codon:yes gene_type:complete